MSPPLVDRPREWTREAATQVIREFVEIEGRAPRSLDWKNCRATGLPSSDAIRRVFGGVDNALKAAGVFHLKFDRYAHRRDESKLRNAEKEVRDGAALRPTARKFGVIEDDLRKRVIDALETRPALANVWKPAEDARLDEMLSQGKGYAAIAKSMKRSVPSIKHRMMKRNLHIAKHSGKAMLDHRDTNLEVGWSRGNPYGKDAGEAMFCRRKFSKDFLPLSSHPQPIGLPLDVGTRVRCSRRGLDGAVEYAPAPRVRCVRWDDYGDALRIGAREFRVVSSLEAA